MSTVPHLFILPCLCVCAEKHNNKYTGLEFTYAEAGLTKRAGWCVCVCGGGGFERNQQSVHTQSLPPP